MTYFYQLFAGFFILVFLSGAHPVVEHRFAINAMLGDESYLKRFGELPSLAVPNRLRIQTHLYYVEKKLRSGPTEYLNPSLQKQRYHLLDLLNQYAKAGKFPENFDYPDQSRPVFIDRNGNLCAVGYLIAKTTGMDFAQAINQRFHNAYLGEMQGKELEKWVQKSGLNFQELAMIQPDYPPSKPLPENPADPNVVIPSLSLDAVNLAVLLAYLIPIEDPTLYQGSRLGGMVIGGATVGWGLFNYGDLQGELSFKSRLSLANIGLGLATFLISYYQWQHPPQPNQPQTWTVGQYPSYASQTALGVNYQHRF
ncbi:MAG: hypothetical protein AB7I41_15675 [Candidatus Sericytochromatia bacterium]